MGGPVPLIMAVASSARSAPNPAAESFSRTSAHRFCAVARCAKSCRAVLSGLASPCASCDRCCSLPSSQLPYWGHLFVVSGISARVIVEALGDVCCRLHAGVFEGGRPHVLGKIAGIGLMGIGHHMLDCIVDRLAD